MRVSLYVIFLSIAIVLSCVSSDKECQTPLAEMKKETSQKSPKSNEEFTAMEVDEQRQEDKFDSVIIGSQVWMGRNLDVSHFRNGDKILFAETADEWKIAGENHWPAWCYYDNKESNLKKCGKLYNWYAVSDKRGLAPDGWRLPKKIDWEQLGRHIGDGNYIAGYSLYAKKLMCRESNGGSNTAGFNAYPAGGRFIDGEYRGIHDYAYFWSTESDKNKYDEFDRAYLLTLMSFAELSGIVSYPKEYGLSVRCIK